MLLSNLLVTSPLTIFVFAPRFGEVMSDLGYMRREFKFIALSVVGLFVSVTTTQFIRDNYWMGLVGVVFSQQAASLWHSASGALITLSESESERQISPSRTEPSRANAAEFTYRLCEITAQLNGGT